MDGKHHRNAMGYISNYGTNAAQYFHVVDIGRAMQGQHGELAILKPLGTRESAGTLDIAQERVDHGVANEMDAVFRNSFVTEVLAGDFVGGEEQIGNGVGSQPVDLLRHGSIA